MAEVEEKAQRAAVSVQEKKRKLAVVCTNGLANFLEWTKYIQGYELRIFKVEALRDIERAIDWADVVWFEWMNEAAIHGTRYRNIVYKDGVIIRCHSYEALSGFHKKINWEAVTDLVFVADHVRDLVKKGLAEPIGQGQIKWDEN